MRILLKIFYESVVIAFNELVNNKLRAFLSLLGITIGILCIITVFTAVDSLERNVRSSIEKLGNNVIYIQKWPWGGGGGSYPWWKYWNRPVADYEEMKTVQERSRNAEAVAIAVNVDNAQIKYRDNVVEEATMMGVSHDYYKIKDFNFITGRFFSVQESNSGAPVVILGYGVADQLLPNLNDAVGREVDYKGRKLRVIGILEAEGEDVLGFSADDQIIMPFTKLRTIISMKGGRNEPLIAVKAREGVALPELKDELKGIMRSVRRLRPREEDDFALNQLSILSQGLSSLFSIINIAGWVIGLFAILVGGFGIANIMFVSVKERTNIIGIKKALGAKSFFILLEFLVESVMLCLLGGAFGMLLVYFLTLFAENAIDFEFTLTMQNIALGVLLSVAIGVVAGFIPAWQAARMRPVDAIRS